MNTGKYIFAQRLQFICKYEFEKRKRFIVIIEIKRYKFKKNLFHKTRINPVHTGFFLASTN